MVDAIRRHLADRDLELSGDCADAELPQDVGKYCYRVVDDRGGEVVVMVGITFSEFESYLLVRQSDGWAVVQAADVPFPDDTGELPF